jgi:hypothetical protein
MNRNVLRAGVFGALLPLAACATGPNGNNEYEAIGRVDAVYDESFHVTDVTIVRAKGSAKSRLADGETIHDNYQDSLCLGNETSNDFDELVDTGQLVIGSVVRVRATVGDSKIECTSSKDGFYQKRSILESMDVVP